MGVLRNWITKLFKFTPQKALTAPICTHPNLPQKQHYTNLVVHAHDHCRTCEVNICMVCSEVHVQQHCVLDLKINKDFGGGKLKQFNVGYLMQLPLSGLKCICGTPLGFQPGHGICAACGMASCSVECHQKWQQMGNCTYHKNYYQKPRDVHMRSILFQNIRNINLAKITQWSLASKSALSYIACYAKAGSNHFYLQRGYRNFGFPQPQLVEKMKKVDFGLDFVTNIERICECQCQICHDRGIHSVGNCEHSCLVKTQVNAASYYDQHQMYHECTCDCIFCRSGIVVHRHTKAQCAQHCYKSAFNLDKL